MRLATAILLLTLPHTATPENPASRTCAMPAPAPPCATRGGNSLADQEPGFSLAIGNPVHLATGGKHQTDIDLPGHPLHPALEIVRHYNSLDMQDGPLGRGWRLSYDTRIASSHGSVSILQADGSRLRPRQDDAVNSATGANASQDKPPRPDLHGSVARNPVDRGWRWFRPDGRTLHFAANGLLIRIQPPPGASWPSVHITRHTDGPLAGTIQRVDSGPATLMFHYDQDGGLPRLASIDTPSGRFRYHHDRTPAASAGVRRLLALERPDGMRREYLHEAQWQSGNAALLTGVALTSTDGRTRLRLGAWDYDRHGRAIGVAHGPRDAAHGYSRLQYLAPAGPGQEATTLVHGPSGLTRFRHLAHADGRHRLTSVQGARCPGCAAPGNQARYDVHGRMLLVNGTHIARRADGSISRLLPDAPGWPGLGLGYLPDGMRSAWTSDLTGQETRQTDALGRPMLRRHANGDSSALSYDDAGLLLTLRETRAATPTAPAGHSTTQLQWASGRLRQIQHPHAAEQREHDTLGHLTIRRETRPLPDGTTWRFTERFDYDALGRLSRHVLPEGGVLHYRWGEAQRLLSITWEDGRGRRRTVIASDPRQPGYRYGNGLHLRVRQSAAQAVALTLSGPDGQRWTLDRTTDAHGRPIHEQERIQPGDALSTHAPDASTATWMDDWRYAYDSQSRLIGMRHAAVDANANANAVWLAWQPDGSLAGRAIARSPRTTERPDIRRDTSGLPQMADGWRLDYGPDRRLQAVHRHGRLLARYTTNAFGQRIRTQSDGHWTDYLYLDNRRVAETRPMSASLARPAIARRYIYAHHVPVGMIDYDHDALYAIHADLIGAPRILTDAQGRVRWLARYDPLGQAERIAGDLTLHLRLPGQWHDPVTGWHDNLLRTYLPRWGQYLEPDPLGPLPGTQALGYADQQPRRYVDPLGLLLFAFDGTRNNLRTSSNVSQLARLYLDGAAYYHSGPGNPYYLDLDAAIAHRAPQILQTQWQHLLSALSLTGGITTGQGNQPAPVPIDILGFSRGAALARHFGHLVASHTQDGLFSYQDPRLGLVNACVDLRFMGLMDTVAQFGIDGMQNDQYQLGIGEAWSWVAHAVALHERRWLFPLTSAGDPASAGNLVQAPFVGAHADIGGGNLLDGSPPRQGDLPDIVLQWLWWQAQAAGVALAPLASDQAHVEHAVLHDQRPALLRSLQDGDRRIDSQHGEPLLAYQDDDPALGRQRRDSAEPVIQRFPDWRNSADDAVGVVDMPAYRAWLAQELGWTAPHAETATEPGLSASTLSAGIRHADDAP